VAGCSTPGDMHEIWFRQATRLRRSLAAARWCSSGGSALCSRLLGGARLCSLLLGSDLGLWGKPQAGGVVVTILTSEGSLVRTQLRPPAGQSVAGDLPDVLMTGEHWLAGECSLGWAGRHSSKSAAGSRRRSPPGWRAVKRKWELVSGETLAAGGALQVFGLVNGVARRQALGAPMGAQFERALSHWVLKGQPRVSRRGCRARCDTLGLIDPASCGDCAV
jgi:hypothetical protein